MAHEIVWTDSAVKDYNGVIDFLIQNWSVDVASEFVDITSKKIHTISLQPLIGVSSKIGNDIRSILLTKHNRLYYKIFPLQIRILNIFDTRQNPDKNKY